MRRPLLLMLAAGGQLAPDGDFATDLSGVVAVLKHGLSLSPDHRILVTGHSLALLTIRLARILLYVAEAGAGAAQARNCRYRAINRC